MNSCRAALGAAALTVPLITAATVMPASAESPAPAPIAVELLTPRSAFTDDLTLQLKVKGDHGNRNVRLKDPSLTAVARIIVQPGARFPLHQHPGPVIVNVARGELTYVDEHCAERVYPAGTAFVDTGTDVHSAFGSSSQPTTLIATFLGAPAVGPLTVPEGVQVPCG
jgi:quercetin dioxygenase-like cupin family protein